MDVNMSQLQETVENRGAWRAAVHEIAKSWTQRSNWTTAITVVICLWSVAGNRLCASLGWGRTVLSYVFLSPPLFHCSAHRGNFSASSLVCWNVHQRFHFVLVCVVAQTHNTALIAGCQGSVMLEIHCKIEGKSIGSGIRQPDSSTC